MQMTTTAGVAISKLAKAHGEHAKEDQDGFEEVVCDEENMDDAVGKAGGAYNEDECGYSLLRCASRVTHRSTRREAITGEDGTDRMHPKGDRNLYKYGFQGTARESRVQNREMEDGGYRMPEIGFR